MIMYYKKTNSGSWVYTGTTSGGNAWIKTTQQASYGPEVRSYADIPSPLVDSQYMNVGLGSYRNYESNYLGNPDWPCRIAQRFDFKAKSVIFLGPVNDVA